MNVVSLGIIRTVGVCIQNLGEWWKVSKTLLNSKKQGDIPPPLYHENTYEKPTDKAKLFNDFLASQSKLNDEGVDLPDNLPDENINILDNIQLTQKDVYDVLNSLDTSKSSGPDSISPKMLKIGAEGLSYPLCKIFNLSLELGKFPANWKKANITPIHKKESQSLIIIERYHCLVVQGKKWSDAFTNTRITL